MEFKGTIIHPKNIIAIRSSDGWCLFCNDKDEVILCDPPEDKSITQRALEMVMPELHEFICVYSPGNHNYRIIRKNNVKSIEVRETNILVNYTNCSVSSCHNSKQEILNAIASRKAPDITKFLEQLAQKRGCKVELPPPPFSPTDQLLNSLQEILAFLKESPEKCKALEEKINTYEEKRKKVESFEEEQFNETFEIFNDRDQDDLHRKIQEGLSYSETEITKLKEKLTALHQRRDKINEVISIVKELFHDIPETVLISHAPIE